MPCLYIYGDESGVSTRLTTASSSTEDSSSHLKRRENELDRHTTKPRKLFDVKSERKTNSKAHRLTPKTISNCFTSLIRISNSLVLSTKKP